MGIWPSIVVVVDTVIALLMVLMAPAASLLSTVWMTRKIKQSEHNTDVAMMVDIVNSDSSSKYKSAEHEKHAKQNIDAQLRETLRSEHSFEPFIQWMCSEYSSENVFAFIECVQFKERAIALMDIHDVESDERRCYLLYPSIPKSSIVHSTNHIRPPNGAAKDLPMIVPSESPHPPSTASPTSSPSYKLDVIRSDSGDRMARVREAASLLYERYVMY